MRHDTIVEMRRRRPIIDRAKKTAYVFAALFPDRVSVDAAALIASRVEDIDGAVVTMLRQRIGTGKLERELVRQALDESARSR